MDGDQGLVIWCGKHVSHLICHSVRYGAVQQEPLSTSTTRPPSTQFEVNRETGRKELMFKTQQPQQQQHHFSQGEPQHIYYQQQQYQQQQQQQFPQALQQDYLVLGSPSPTRGRPIPEVPDPAVQSIYQVLFLFEKNHNFD